MNDHYFTPRAERHHLYDDREIERVSRCYRCRGHHAAELCAPRCATWFAFVALAAALAGAACAALWLLTA